MRPSFKQWVKGKEGAIILLLKGEIPCSQITTLVCKVESRRFNQGEFDQFHPYTSIISALKVHVEFIYPI